MRLDKFTTKFQTAISDAQSMALGRDHQYIEPAHIITALLNQQGGSVRSVLQQANINLNSLRYCSQALKSYLESRVLVLKYNLVAECVSLFNVCDKLSQQYNDQYISSELFLLAAVQNGGAISELLKVLARAFESIANAINAVRDGQAVTDQNAEDVREALTKYTTDLTERATQGKLDPVIGRDDEIRRTIQV